MTTLFLSGLIAIPVETELSFLSKFFPPGSTTGQWIDKVYYGFQDTNNKYPFLSYGYDWLAFAHFVLAILFFGPLKDPVRNKWVIEFGMIACMLILPFAFIAGHFRQIPIGWRLVDCSFGLLGLIPLGIVYQQTIALEKKLIAEETSINKSEVFDY
ncbi:MAG: hypothetical protein M3O67_10385 [Bacteroidota bacterium]|nr:hypothetical protein [Bacteroidota bacterium]